MAFVNEKDVKSGDILIADAGFTCVGPGPVEIMGGEGKSLYFECCHGQHFLDGQRMDDGTLIGLSKPE